MRPNWTPYETLIIIPSESMISAGERERQSHMTRAHEILVMLINASMVNVTLPCPYLACAHAFSRHVQLEFFYGYIHPM